MAARRQGPRRNKAARPGKDQGLGLRVRAHSRACLAWPGGVPGCACMWCARDIAVWMWPWRDGGGWARLKKGAAFGRRGYSRWPWRRERERGCIPCAVGAKGLAFGRCLCVHIRVCACPGRGVRVDFVPRRRDMVTTARHGARTAYGLRGSDHQHAGRLQER